MDNNAPDWEAVYCFLANYIPDFNPGDVTVPLVKGRLLELSVNEWSLGWVPDCFEALGCSDLADDFRQRACARGNPKPDPTPDIVIKRSRITDTFRGRIRTREVFQVWAPYSMDFNNHSVPSRWFNKESKAWHIPVVYEPQLREALKACFKGSVVKNPDDTFETL